MKSWRCDCSRINPCFEDKCLSCEKTRPDFQPKPLPPMENIPLDNADQPEFEKPSDEELSKAYCEWADKRAKLTLVKREGELTEDQKEWGKSIIEHATSEWIKKYIEAKKKQIKADMDKYLDEVVWGSEHEAIMNRNNPNINQGFLPLLKTDSMPENKVILETPAGKYVPLELLERALSEWNGRRKKPLTNDMLFQIFRNEFPEINLQVVGHEVKAV